MAIKKKIKKPLPDKILQTPIEATDVQQPVKTTASNRDIKDLVKIEVFKQNVLLNNLTELSDEQKKIARSVSQGLDDSVIVLEHNIDSTYLQQLYSNPKFMQEVKMLTYNDHKSFANQDRRVQMISRLSNMLFEDLVQLTPEQLAEVPVDKKMKIFKEFAEVMEKSVGENKNIKVDITVALQEKIKSANANIVKDARTGELRIESSYPTINSETGKIEGANSSDYIFEDESNDV